MLVGTVDGALDKDVPIDVIDSISIGEHVGQATVPGPVCSVQGGGASTLLAGAEVPTGQVAPGDAVTVAVDSSLDDPVIALKRSGSIANVRGQYQFDPCPLLISENSVSLLCGHVFTVLAPCHRIEVARSSRCLELQIDHWITVQLASAVSEAVQHQGGDARRPPPRPGAGEGSRGDLRRPRARSSSA